ncbi:MAG: metal ABC transporter permease [Deltaproteobacteria bacterium]|jgi:zinc transport system permease protein|nr:metal ABC transporter permease [Deltaproteobacteria bacterium]MBW2450689.1 metal ABC transporter permease [Deltaproteobacteria bacterium]MBW2492724.1 metal ABC transporter permease [Deltaproteobacteria bacterium]
MIQNVQPVIATIKIMIDIFSLQFMQNAFLAGMMLSFVLAVVSFFVVLRRLSFIGVGVAHSAFGGVALGALLGISPTLTAIGFAVVISNAIGYIGKEGHLGTDTAIGIFFPLAMALGVIFIGMSDQYNVDLFGYLFGNILAITRQDLIIIAILGGLVLLSTVMFFKELLFVAYDREVAFVSGMPVAFLDHFFLTILALSVVISMKIIGIILVSALLVIPGAAASQITHRYNSMIVISILIALISTSGGLVISYYADLPSGATIVTLASLIFFATFIIGRTRN